MSAEDTTRKEVSEYYGKVLSSSDDLATNACVTSKRPPQKILQILSLIHDDVTSRYYGCGLTIPKDNLEGLTVVDLGSGSGRDCYILSHLVGPKGHVIGIDMTEEQLSVARKHIDYHTKQFGFSSPNIEFIQGNIEDLKTAGIKDNSVDLIVSNCVVNLSPNKNKVLSEAFRVLKPGGEMYFSDVYSDRRIPITLVRDKVLWGECLSGALYWNDFLTLARKSGFTDPRLVEDHPITVNNKKLEALIGNIHFYSATYRLWKIAGLEQDCEDYGQAVIYKGTIPDFPHLFSLDNHHTMEKGKVFPVCANTNLMLKSTRLAKHFDFLGVADHTDPSATHYGIYQDCGKKLPFSSANSDSNDKKESCSKGGCC